MADLNVNSIANSAGTGPVVLDSQWAVKAGWNLIMSTSTLNDGDNVGSVTDNGAGKFSMNFTNNFSDITSMKAVLGGPSESGSPKNYSYGLEISLGAITTSSISTVNEDSDGDANDLTGQEVMGLVGGTLA